MKLAVSSLVLAALIACGAPSADQLPADAVVHEPCGPLVVVPPDGATDVQRAGIERATQLWNARGFTRLAVSGDGEPIALHFEKAASFFHGLYDPKTGEITINTLEDDEAELGVVIAHELGHAMGLSHVQPNDRASVMNPGNVTQTPTAADSDGLQRRCGS